MSQSPLYYIQKDRLCIVPIVHYNMEIAAYVKQLFHSLNPNCVAVELPDTMQLQMLHAASRLPDISLVLTYDKDNQPLYFLSEPCDPIFEALRSALENNVATYCIDLDVEKYPESHDLVPDPYAIHQLGFKTYYELFEKARLLSKKEEVPQDYFREIYMAKRLKELSFHYEKILVVIGMAHVSGVLRYFDQHSFPHIRSIDRDVVQVCTVTEEASRELLYHGGYFSAQYELFREKGIFDQIPNRKKFIYRLYKEASEKYIREIGNSFPGYNLRNLIKFAHHYALVCDQLIPDLFKILTAAKGCVDHNYAYEVWELATNYPYLRNIDGLVELDPSIEEVWGQSKHIRFRLKQKSLKNSSPKVRKDRTNFRFKPPNPFAICSYPPEDIAIEGFADFLKKKGCQLLTEEGAQTIPFSSSLEDGIDTKETIRHWHERKLYVKTKGKPPSGVGSVCMIFDEDQASERLPVRHEEKYSWRTTWIGEHQQESDMAFYATSIAKHVVGPGISRCEYGGFMMSYPPRRLNNIWHDQDYQECRSKSEVLLMAAIDYAIKPVIVYVAKSPPRSIFKSYASRFGKKIVYLPIGQLSPVTVNKLRTFHVLDGQDKRAIADEYIY